MGAAIGVVGGVGPYAGLDLMRKIFDQTVASKDQEHLDVYLSNIPSEIQDRTDFLLHGGDNPARGLLLSAQKLISIGATTIVIPCNTAHAQKIFGMVKEQLATEHPNVQLLHMIEETAKEITRQFPADVTIGLMATLGTHAAKVYQQTLASYPQVTIIEPDIAEQRCIHEAIYNQSYGIKAVSPVTEMAIQSIKKEGQRLIDRGAQALILGCTELPLALKNGDLSVPLIDPTLVLARSAIAATASDKLRSL